MPKPVRGAMLAAKPARGKTDITVGCGGNHPPTPAGSMTRVKVSVPQIPTAKVLFRVARQEGGEDAETLWAFDLGANRYRIDNFPFYAYGVSLGDIVLAPFDPEKQLPTFQEVVVKSGNRTLRIILDEPTAPGNKSERILDELNRLGCGYEGANKRYFAVNIPPSIDLAAVTTILNANRVTWEYADPRYEDVHGADKR